MNLWVVALSIRPAGQGTTLSALIQPRARLALTPPFAPAASQMVTVDIAWGKRRPSKKKNCWSALVLALRNKTAKTPKQSLKGSTRHFPLFWHHSASFQIYFYPPKQNLQTLGILQRVNAVTGSRKKSKKNAHKMHIPGNFEEKNTKECEGKEPQIPPRFWCCCRDLSGFCRNFLGLSGFVGICRALNTGGGVPITSFGGSWSKAKWRVILVLFYVIRPSLSSIKTQLWGAQKHQQLDRGRFGLLQNVFCQKKAKMWNENVIWVWRYWKNALENAEKEILWTTPSQWFQPAMANAELFLGSCEMKRSLPKKNQENWQFVIDSNSAIFLWWQKKHTLWRNDDALLYWWYSKFQFQKKSSHFQKNPFTKRK